MISAESLDRFKAIYREEFGRDISSADARVQAEKLVKFLAIARQFPNKQPYNQNEAKRLKDQIILKLEKDPSWHRR